MGTRLLPLLFLSGSVALLAVEGTVAGGRFQTLIEHNPFAPPEPPPAPPPPEPPPTLELRGVLSERGTLWFSLYDPESKKGTWVRRDETIADYRVGDFDLVRETLQLERRNLRFDLALKSSPGLGPTGSTRSLVFASAAAARVRSEGRNPLPVMTLAGNPAPLSEPVRQASIAQQIQQRRVHRLRQNSSGI